MRQKFFTRCVIKHFVALTAMVWSSRNKLIKTFSFAVLGTIVIISLQCWLSLQCLDQQSLVPDQDL